MILFNCQVCGRQPHPIDDPQCMPATKTIVEQNRWLIDENARLRTLLARAGITTDITEPGNRKT